MGESCKVRRGVALGSRSIVVAHSRKSAGREVKRLAGVTPVGARETWMDAPGG